MGLGFWVPVGGFFDEGRGRPSRKPIRPESCLIIFYNIYNNTKKIGKGYNMTRIVKKREKDMKNNILL